MDCRYCEIQVEITKRAYVARCPDPVAVLDHIRIKMKGSTRPRVDLSDMKRLRQPLAPKQEEEMTATDDDALTTAAKAIGTTLGKLAVKTGMATPPGGACQGPEESRSQEESSCRQGSTKKIGAACEEQDSAEE